MKLVSFANEERPQGAMKEPLGKLGPQDAQDRQRNRPKGAKKTLNPKPEGFHANATRRTPWGAASERHRMER